MLDFQTIRPLFGGSLTQSQVDGITTILSGWERYGNGDNETLAYLLATTYHETAKTMQPIHERGAKAYFNKYEPGTKIGAVLGNTLKGDGYKFRGRGYVQLTGRSNYARAGKIVGTDLVADPDAALNPNIAVRLLIAGPSNGWYTGKKLSDYIDGVDETDAEDLREYIAARRTINGQDKAEVIGKLALVFERALRAAPVPAPAPTLPLPEPDDAIAPPPEPISFRPTLAGWGLLLVLAVALAGAAWILFT